MSHKFHPTYLKSTDELKTLTDAALALLERPEGRHSTYLEQEAYRLFEKLTLQLSTLFKVLPGTDSFGDSKVQYWDFSSAAVLGRQILEDCLAESADIQKVSDQISAGIHELLAVLDPPNEEVQQPQNAPLAPAEYS
jgi:hypothetical protein